MEPQPRGPRRPSWKIVAAISAAIALVGAAVVGVAVLGNRGNGPAHSTAAALAVPSVLSVVTATTNSITLSWTYPAGAVTVDRFWVYRNGQPVGSVTADRLTFRDIGLKPGNTYRYQVAAEVGVRRSELPPAVLATTDIPGRAAATLDGTYTVKITITSFSGFDEGWCRDFKSPPGVPCAEAWMWGKGNEPGDWYFTSRSFGALLHGFAPDTWTMKLFKYGTRYNGRARSVQEKCPYVQVAPVESVVLRLRVTDGEVHSGTWRVAKWEGTLTVTIPRTPSEGEPSCGPGLSIIANVVGTPAL